MTTQEKESIKVLIEVAHRALENGLFREFQSTITVGSAIMVLSQSIITNESNNAAKSNDNYETQQIQSNS
jgi:hypothetical protein